MIVDTTHKIIDSVSIQLSDSTIKLDTIVNLNQLFINLNSVNNNGFWETWASSIFGLIGVLIGAFIAYFTNSILLKKQTISKFSIQRKNLIIAPLYKELTNLKECFHDHVNEGFINVNYGQ